MKTTKPIRLLVMGINPLTPALEQLIADGHTINMLPDLVDADMIIGPKCWRYLPDVSDKFIKLIVKEARAAQPPRPKKVKAKRGTTAG